MNGFLFSGRDYKRCFYIVKNVFREKSEIICGEIINGDYCTKYAHWKLTHKLETLSVILFRVKRNLFENLFLLSAIPSCL